MTIMIEPTRNDRCNDLPRTIGCTGHRLHNPGDTRYHLDPVKSAAIMGILNDCHHTLTDLIALGNVVRLTCWS
jgi:hypothetical protein